MALIGIPGSQVYTENTMLEGAEWKLVCLYARERWHPKKMIMKVVKFPCQITVLVTVLIFFI